MRCQENRAHSIYKAFLTDSMGARLDTVLLKLLILLMASLQKKLRVFMVM